MTLTQARLQQVLDYSPETGVFTWKTPRGRGVKAGDKAGGVNNDGYIQIGVEGKTLLAHRLAWLYMTGTWPQNQIHHINHNEIDNRISNLSDVTNRENNSNKRIHKEGHLVGTCFHKRLNKWMASIRINGRIKHLGYFLTRELASTTYQMALANINNRL